MLLRNWLGFWIMVGIALFSLIGFFPGEEETPYVLKEQMESCLILFYIGFAGIFIYWLMPVINERVLLLHTITFQYLIWSLFREYIDKYPAIFAVFAGVPTMAVLVFACTPLQLPGSLRLSAYFWYLAVTSAILAAQVLSSGIEPIYDHGIDSLSSFCLVVSTGMTMLFLSANVLYILSFIPFRYKEETFAERSAEIKKQARFMVGRYSDAQLPLWQTAAIIVVQGGLLCANAIWKVLDDWLAINISVILTAELGATQGKRKLMLPMGLRVDDGLQ